MADPCRELAQSGQKVATTDSNSTIALNFSEALDDIFNLGSSGELAMNVEQKYDLPHLR